MHSPLSTQAFAHLREASGPSPVRRMSMMPAMTARGSAFTPPGPVTGQTSTHLPQRVQASAIAATRSERAVSNVTVMRTLRGCDLDAGLLAGIGHVADRGALHVALPAQVVELGAAVHG